jgi:hypothetical protein
MTRETNTREQAGRNRKLEAANRGRQADIPEGMQ